METTKMEFNDYRNHPSLSRSDLSAIYDSPFAWRYEKELGRSRRKKTDGMDFGSLFHEYFLEKDIFDKKLKDGTYIINPGLDRRTKEGKDFFANLSEDTVILNSKDLETCQEMMESSRSHEIATMISAKLKELPDNVERSVFWEMDGINCKARLDFFFEIDGNLFLVDLKTTAHSGVKAISRYAADNDYYYQMFFYGKALEALTGKLPTNYIIMAAETNWPHPITTMALTELDLQKGEFTYKKYLEKAKWCLDNDHWPRHSSTMLVMSETPTYAYNELFN